MPADPTGARIAVSAIRNVIGDGPRPRPCQYTREWEAVRSLDRRILDAEGAVLFGVHAAILPRPGCRAPNEIDRILSFGDPGKSFSADKLSLAEFD